MKKRLTGKPACIAILAVLIITSLAEVVLRSVLLKEAMLGLANAGEPIITALFALMLILFALKGKGRLFYIVCGAFLGYFVLKQLFGLPALVADFVVFLPSVPGGHFVAVAIALHLLSAIGIIAIGGLLVEYMNDGTIYNKAFNTLCIITVLMLIGVIAINIFAFAPRFDSFTVLAGAVLSAINGLSRLTMIFLFVTFAYDSAKKQLAKTKLTK